MQATADVLIVGGGLVGSSLALALSGGPWSVALIEATPAGSAPPPGFDERNLALARASLDALSRLGVLARLARAPEPIRRIHVSRVGDFGSVDLRAAEHGVEAFGGVVMARDLGLALQASVQGAHAVRHLRGTRVEGIEAVAAGWRLRLRDAAGESTIDGRLLVAADGSDSPLCRALGIDAEQHDYGQQLLVCSVNASRAEPGCAWERFSEHGPVALLPRNDGRWGAVCGVADGQAAEVLALDDSAYASYLQQRFGWRAGQLGQPGRRSAYPLRKIAATRLIADRAVLIGNAAQTLHPIGAQGFNLGLRDALSLASRLRDADDPGDAALLQAYAEGRREDRERTLAFSDGLARLTTTPGDVAHLLRSLGLIALGGSRTLQQPLVQSAMGLRGMPVEWRGASA